MRYYTASEIRQYQFRYNNPILENSSRRYRTNKTVFLSHSHKDADLVMPAVQFLLSQGITVYVDWLDTTMPAITSTETAKKIKEKIRQCDKFVVLLSSNAKDSKWVPWELGYGDGVKGESNIAILPILRNRYDDFAGVEYMALYPKIGLQQIGSTLKPVIEKDMSRLNARSLNEQWIQRSDAVF